MDSPSEQHEAAPAMGEDAPREFELAAADRKMTKRIITSKAIADEADHLWVVDKAPMAMAQLHMFDDPNQLEGFVCTALAERNRAACGIVPDDVEGRSMSTVSDDDEPVLHTYWVDVQTRNGRLVNDVLSIFPIHPDAKEMLVARDPEAVDLLEVFKSHVVLNLVASALEGEEAAEVLIHVVAFRDWVITIHDRPFASMVHFVRQLQHFTTPHHALSWHLSSGWLLCALITNTIECVLPQYMRFVAKLNETCAKAAQGPAGDEGAFSQLQALFTDVDICRAVVLRRQTLLGQCTSSVFRRSFLCTESLTPKYFRAATHLNQVADLLELGHDTVLYTNTNFSRAIALNMARVSNRINAKMKFISEVTAIFYPMLLVPNLYGMNITVPYMYGMGYTATSEFAIITSVSFGWLVLCLLYLYWPRRHNAATAVSK